MEQFLKQLQTLPEVAGLVRRVEEGGCPAAVTGLQSMQRACVGAAVARAAGSGMEVRITPGDSGGRSGVDFPCEDSCED